MREQVKGEEAMEMFKLVKANNLLPQKVEDLVPLSFIGSAAVRYYRDVISLMDQLGVTEAQRKATLRDGQDAGELLLDIEARIGELLPSAEEAQKLSHKIPRSGLPRSGPHQKVLPEGITERKAHQARTIKAHPDIVARVKAQARENEDIPTKTAVLNAISYEKEKARQAAVAPIKESLRRAYPEDQVLYINSLDQCIRIIPQKPPRDWNDAALREATAKARIIMKRLEVFACHQTKNQIAG